MNFSTTRLLQHFQDSKTLAIISPYRVENSKFENEMNLRELKKKVRAMDLGYSELLSKWAEKDPETGKIEMSDERALMIYGISYKDAMKIGDDYLQASIIFKDASKCAEVCVRPFVDASGKQHAPGKVIRTFDVKSNPVLNAELAKEIFSNRAAGAASKPVKSNRPFVLKEMYLVESARISMFSDGCERYIKLFEF